MLTTITGRTDRTFCNGTLLAVAGDDMPLRLEVANGARAPVDVTGWTATVTLRKIGDDKTIAAVLDGDDDAATGVLTGSIAAATTEDAAGVWSLEVRCLDTDSITSTVADAELVIRD